MKAYQPLNCDLHDYLEIACMHQYDLHIELLQGPGFVARALTTRTAPSKEEFLVLENEEGQGVAEVRLDQLLAITPLDSNASFGRIALAGAYCAF
ncbi:Rho-binding antiterminator [Pseudomonas sp. T8]|uniref:Rho-binding antiterminator n=1 Tax=Pseudomonas sp. T8 TaxID=645292 RepID=UPI002148161E|nr:Rho-binding antiterminator [Pseudomonas sp. T8]UUT22918.1 Rho-binding antiterminator [Pseudomonas sp. T8]